MTNTVSHKTAQALKEAGWEKGVREYWHIHPELVGEPFLLRNLKHKSKFDFPAPTFSEIWEELPEGRTTIKAHSLDFDDGIHAPIMFLLKDNNITEAAAALWLKLREEKLI